MTETFNLRDLSLAIAQKFDVTNQSGAEIANFVFDTIKDEVAAGKQVRLHKFGTVEARHRAAGVARNPVTGERIPVPERRVVKLTVSPALKKFVADYDKAMEAAASTAASSADVPVAERA
jgi:nucleoid DNA-binding protein